MPLLRAALEGRESGKGSNWWVASGRVTDSGRPILANDPHLELGTPSIFYEAQVRVASPAGIGRPPLNAFGVTPGVPPSLTPDATGEETTTPSSDGTSAAGATP